MTYTSEKLRQVDISIARWKGYTVKRTGTGEAPYTLHDPDENYITGSVGYNRRESWQYVPEFTTDANAALPLLPPGWYLSRDELTGWRVLDVWDKFRSSDEITPALAICRARFPALFAVLEEVES